MCVETRLRHQTHILMSVRAYTHTQLSDTYSSVIVVRFILSSYTVVNDLQLLHGLHIEISHSSYTISQCIYCRVVGILKPSAK